MRRILAVAAVATVAAAGAALPAGPAAAASTTVNATAAAGTFTTLSYNVAGLPEALSSASTPRVESTTTIGSQLGPYDLVHVQEDFNYHAYLYAADNHPYRTPTSGGAGIGSGLNTLSALPYDEDDFERVRWDSCQLDSGDCLTPKGFTFMRVRVSEGVYLHVYNLHANAGTSDGDLQSRASNLAQLTDFIQSHSAGQAVVVMGDTNTRYTRAGDTIAEFAAANGLADPWVQLERGGVAPAKGADALTCDEAAVTDTCEVVDKVLYRGSAALRLTATSYANENAKFLNAAGKRLSDHYPIAVGFSWATNPAYAFSEQFGGPHADYFTDLPKLPEGAQPTAVSLRTGARVDQVGVTLSNGTKLSHGGSGGTASALTLGSGEYVASASLCQAQKDGHTRIFFIAFTTNLGRTLAGGSTTSDCTTRTAPAGWQIAGFTGRSADEVDKLGFVYTPKAVRLVNQATGKCLDVNGTSGTNGARVQIWTCNGGTNQLWRVEPLADGTNRIVNLASGKPLDVASCGTADGTTITQWTWLDNACQRWTITGSGWVTLRNPNSGKVADVANCGSADGTEVRLWTALGNTCQAWSIKV